MVRLALRGRRDDRVLTELVWFPDGWEPSQLAELHHDHQGAERKIARILPGAAQSENAADASITWTKNGDRHSLSRCC